MARRALHLIAAGLTTLIAFNLFATAGYASYDAVSFDWPFLAQGPASSLELVQQRHNNRTAVVWTAMGLLTPCATARVRHLVETSGGEMDVWVLHSHHKLTEWGRHEEVQRSLFNLASILGLKGYQGQDPTPILPFDELAGSSKSSFLRFLANHPEYDHAWIVENDVFFTGRWEQVFGPESDNLPSSDFLTSRAYSQANTDWYWWQNCFLFQRPCTQVVDPAALLQVHWMFARVSRRLVTSLLGDLQNGQVQGHHEAVVAAYCRLKGFVLGTIHQDLVAKAIKVGHDGGDDTHRDVESFRPLPNTLVHPVKCTADGRENIQRSIEKYVGKQKGMS